MNQVATLGTEIGTPFWEERFQYAGVNTPFQRPTIVLRYREHPFRNI
jgi:hypothetical protein